MAQGCIFCGSRKDLSREHVVPDWLRHILPRIADSHIHRGVRLAYATDGIKVTLIYKEHQGNFANRQKRNVCKLCNEGWMSILQQQAIPVLTPLIQGVWDGFDENVAALIVPWSCMTASAIAMSYADTEGVTQADRSYIREHVKAPPNWSVFLGRASGFPPVSYGNRPHLAASRTRGFVYGTEANVNVTTIVLGKLIVQTINSAVGDILPPAYDYGADLGLLPIHPWEPRLPWRFIPVVNHGSEEHDQVLNAYSRALAERR
jgi:hypothetical protein